MGVGVSWIDFRRGGKVPPRGRVVVVAQTGQASIVIGFRTPRLKTNSRGEILDGPARFPRTADHHSPIHQHLVGIAEISRSGPLNVPFPYSFAALRPAMRPKVAPETSPVPPG